MKNKITISGAFLFFLLVQWYGIYFMLYNHPGPLGLDDSDFYIQQIDFFREFPLSSPSLAPSNINKILHPYIFGLLASLMGISATSMFHLNFYIGIFLMGLTITSLVKKIDSSALFTVIALLLFAFHEGKGSYHGFFWVVPSFYAIMLFLLTARAVFYSKHHYIYGLPLLALLLVTHSTGIYLGSLIVVAILLHETLFKRNLPGIKKLVAFLLAVSVIFIGSEYLYQQHILPASFTSSFNSYRKVEFQNLMPATALNDILETIGRHDFSKYFYGLYTPLVVYGLYWIWKEKKYPLLSLFMAALIGQILISPLSNYTYRFFYPLEILTWIVIAYGLSKLLQPREWSTAGITAKTSRWALVVLSSLFLYNTIHQKAAHNFYFKFYNPLFLEAKAFTDYLDNNQDKKLAMYVKFPGVYTGLQQSGMDFAYHFNPSGKNIARDPESWLVIGENLRLYEANNGGFRALLPKDGALHIKTPALLPGRYRIELIDTELPGTDGISISADGVTLSDWQEDSYAVRFPEKGMYPPIMPPWYWFPDTTWPLHNRPMRKTNIVRESRKHSIDFTLHEPTASLMLRNSGEARYLAGMIQLTNLDTGLAQVIDFYWGDETTLKEGISMVYGDKELPLLWTDPNGAPGRAYLFQMKKAFKDAKAFTYYGKSSEL